MTIDANRAAFIKQEYRWATSKTPAILAADKSAREVEIASNVDDATAAALAASILSQNASARIHQLRWQGYMTLDDFIDNVPRYIPDLENFGTDGGTYLLLSFSNDLNTNITEATVFG